MYDYRRPPKPPKPVIPKALYLLFAAILLVSTGVIVNYLYNNFRYAHGAPMTVEATPHVDEEPTPRPTPPPTPTPTPTIAPAAIYEDIQEPTPEPEPESTPEPAPAPQHRVPRREILDWRAHYGNDDIIGHLWIPDTTINYLVAQGTDNDFYLYHDLRGRRYQPGSIFLDYLADIHNPGDQNWVLYGHNMRRNHKFHMVSRWLNQDFFFANRYIYFSTIYADYVFEVFSVYITHTSFNYIMNVYDDWYSKIREFEARSRFDSGITVTEHDRILTLSTCDPGYRNNRIVVHGVLISETFPT